MAKISTTLQNIEYIKQEEEKRQITQQEEREEQKNYNNFVNETIKEEIYFQFEKEKDTQKTYKNLFLNNKYINNIIQIIDEEAQTQYKLITKWKKDKNGNFKESTEKLFLWDSFVNYNDITQLYYKILETIKKEYEKADKLREATALEKLEKYLILNYTQHLYNSCNQLFYKYDTIEKVKKEIAISEQEEKAIQENYYKILDRVDKIFKKQQVKEKEQKNQHTGAIFAGAAIYGIFKGIKNATK